MQVPGFRPSIGIGWYDSQDRVGRGILKVSGALFQEPGLYVTMLVVAHMFNTNKALGSIPSTSEQSGI